MEAELKSRWTARLRSGEYRQGKGALRKLGKDSDSFCCLGVLCEIAVEDGKAHLSKQHEVVGWNYNYNQENSLLPIELHAWSGICLDDREELMSMNDAAGKTFEEIADWIDENL